MERMMSRFTRFVYTCSWSGNLLHRNVTAGLIADNEEIVVPESYIVSDSSVNEKNREFVKLQNDIRETRNVYIQTALAKKAQDRNKLLGMHTKNFKNLRAKIPAIMEAIADLNGIAVPYPLHLKNLPDLNTLPAGNKSAY